MITCHHNVIRPLEGDDRPLEGDNNPLECDNDHHNVITGLYKVVSAF